MTALQKQIKRNAEICELICVGECITTNKSSFDEKHNPYINYETDRELCIATHKSMALYCRPDKSNKNISWGRLPRHAEYWWSKNAVTTLLTCHFVYEGFSLPSMYKEEPPFLVDAAERFVSSFRSRNNTTDYFRTGLVTEMLKRLYLLLSEDEVKSIQSRIVDLLSIKERAALAPIFEEADQSARKFISDPNVYANILSSIDLSNPSFINHVIHYADPHSNNKWDHAILYALHQYARNIPTGSRAKLPNIMDRLSELPKTESSLALVSELVLAFMASTPEKFHLQHCGKVLEWLNANKHGDESVSLGFDPEEVLRSLKGKNDTSSTKPKFS